MGGLMTGIDFTKAADGSSGYDMVNSVHQMMSTVVKAMVKSNEDCWIKIQGDQSIQINADFSWISGIKQIATYAIDSKCANKSDITASMQAAMVSAIKQSLTAKSTSISLNSGDNTENTQTIEDMCQASISDIMNTSCKYNTKMGQTIKINAKGSVVKNISQDARISGALACVSASKTAVKMINDLSASSSQKMVQDTTATIGADIVKSVMNGLASVFKTPMYIIGAIVMAIILIMIIPMLGIGKFFKKHPNAAAKIANAAAKKGGVDLNLDTDLKPPDSNSPNSNADQSKAEFTGGNLSDRIAYQSYEK